MGAYELILTEAPRNGRFRKGNIPHNKGKRWQDYMSKSAQRRAKRGWNNLIEHRKNGACAGWNRRAVVAVTEDGVFVGRFASGAEAGRLTGIQECNILACCGRKPRRVKIRGKEYYCIRKHAGKTIDGRRLRWFYEDDDSWTELIINNL